jgi:predicted RNA polymerase sigma factor
LLRRGDPEGFEAGPGSEDALRIQHGEIALRLFLSEANVLKRLGRAREHLREVPPDFDCLPLQALQSRLASVHVVLYLLFNEGYLSAQPDRTIRREMCDEAIRLTTLLTEHSVGATPETFALLALMHFHGARLTARLDGMGGLLLLEEQDRSLWDQDQMRLGAECLQKAASGETFTRFHAEAGIAAGKRLLRKRGVSPHEQGVFYLPSAIMMVLAGRKARVPASPDLRFRPGVINNLRLSTLVFANLLA